MSTSNRDQPSGEEPPDEGLKLAKILIKLCHVPTVVMRSEWQYLDSFRIGMLQEEAHYSHRQAMHVANQIDRLQAELSGFGRWEFFTDAVMMQVIGCSFCLAGVLLALKDLPDALVGRLIVPISLGLGVLLMVIPFINRKRALTDQKDSLKDAVIGILGTGLMKRKPAVTAKLIKQLGDDTRRNVVQLIQKFLFVTEGKVPEHERMETVHSTLKAFGMSMKDLPLPLLNDKKGREKIKHGL
ncbi:MAG: hypothetical protein LUC43_00950 [Burkholderiales bacterium]|nr:hypothetical protein [Burkholderiales bacterium]